MPRGIMRNLIISALFFGAAIFMTHLLSKIHDDNNSFAIPVFVMAVTLISRFTTGYCYGILASLAGVFCMNYFFSYPFGKFDMSITGYPLTFIVMLLVSVTISTLTTQVKQQEHLRFEAEAEKMRADLLRSVSHDIRTPLASIMGASSALLESKALPASDRDDLLREINKDASWLVRVTENLLSVTKFSSEGIRLKKSDEVVEEIVSSAIVKFRRSHPSLQFTVRKPEEILLVPMDATLIEQVLLNLFENVVMHAGGATGIWVTIGAAPNRVTVSVADDGAGIPQAQIAHLFDGGTFPGTAQTTDGRRNMGIGLSVCRSIIHAHGGGMTAANQSGGGAVISFWLPQEESEHEH